MSEVKGNNSMLKVKENMWALILRPTVAALIIKRSRDWISTGWAHTYSEVKFDVQSRYAFAWIRIHSHDRSTMKEPTGIIFAEIFLWETMVLFVGCVDSSLQ